MEAIRPIPPAAQAEPKTADAAREKALKETARAFETVFIAQMLQHGGLAKALGADAGFGGEAFSSLLVEKYAEGLADKGGFGLADKIYAQLRAMDDRS